MQHTKCKFFRNLIDGESVFGVELSIRLRDVQEELGVDVMYTSVFRFPLLDPLAMADISSA